MHLQELQQDYPLKTIAINGKVWKYIVTGEGKETFVLLPGGGQSVYHTFDIFQEIEKKYKVIVIQLYDIDSVKDFVDGLNRILDKEHSHKVIIYGLSIGGLLGQSYLIRNKDRVSKLILSHTCTPRSQTYKKQVVLPMRILKHVLPIIPQFLITLALKYGGKIQGINNKDHDILIKDMDQGFIQLNQEVSEEYTKKYFNKRLLKTWSELHLEISHNEKFNQEVLKGWSGKVLVIRTDNDPLMQDEGEFVRIYPQAKVNTFHKTGHLSFYYRSKEIVKLIKDFLQ